MEEINKDKKTEIKKVKITKDDKDMSVEQKVSFDAYFRMLMTKDVSIRPHHKAPMKNWVQGQGYETATVRDFDKILKKY